MTDLSKPIGSRMDALREYVRQLPEKCHVLETGTMRGTTPAHITGDGWSTAILAYEVHQKDGLLVTIDINNCTKHLDESIPEPYRNCVTHIVGDTKDQLPPIGISVAWDMVLLDSHRDPHVQQLEFTLIHGYMKPEAFLAIDDHKVKGELLVPILKQQGWKCLREKDPQVWQR